MSRAPATALAVLAAAACTPARGPQMEPGEDCRTCHDATHHYYWSAAGTVFQAFDSPAEDGRGGVKVELTDADGRTLALVTNPAGNFYTAEALRPPLRPVVRVGDRAIAMPMPAESGSCNECHRPEGDVGGRLVAPD